MLITNGNFYPSLTKKRGDSGELKLCIEETVTSLLEHQTDYKKPGMLLGKIQSGKTRAFIGVIGLAFDNDYDMVIILTKGTKALAEQTIQRLLSDFEDFVDKDEIQIHDIMYFPENLTPWELKQKLIIVVKKEINNLKKVFKALDNTYPDLKNKKLLIIDDEADFASVSFRKDKDTGNVELGKIAKTIDDLRSKVLVSDFLQVTATPYSLYLQPDGKIDLNKMVFKPRRPLFTKLLPIHDLYVGGDFYFGQSQDPNSTAYYIYEEVPLEEREILKQNDRRRFKLEEVLISKSIKVIRKAIVNFIVGGSIRRIQQQRLGESQEKYSFVVHTEQARSSHNWQENIVMKMNEELIIQAKSNGLILTELIKDSYCDLEKSIKLSGLEMPRFEEISVSVVKSLQEGFVMVTRVNSDNDVKQLLDNKGQLKLRTPLNIFIGGQILDRGITIKNLVGFYYGRNPQRFQQDTVLQHSRMYGSRNKGDLAITRFYTTQHIYEMMYKINDFDEALREAFLKGAQRNGIYFIRKDELNRLIPCSPNKLLMSKITTLRPGKRILPIGFQTDYKTYMIKVTKSIDSLILAVQKNITEVNGAYLINIDLAIQLLKESTKSFNFDGGFEWDIKGAIASLEHVSKINIETTKTGKVWLLIREEGNIARRRPEGRFSNDPDGGAEGAARSVAMKIATDTPALIMIRQNGDEEKGWRGSPFWWPIIVMPKNTPTSIFASEIIDD